MQKFEMYRQTDRRPSDGREYGWEAQAYFSLLEVEMYSIGVIYYYYVRGIRTPDGWNVHSPWFLMIGKLEMC